MKITHISDLHISQTNKFKNIHFLKKILDYIIKENYDHLVITGDLVDNSKRSDFKLLRNIFKDYNMLKSNKMSLIIGNHDIFGGIETAEDIVNFPKKCLLINYKKKVEEFTYYFRECFENCYFPLKSEFFPFAKILNNIVFIGVNSIQKYSRIRNLFASNGKISKKQNKLLDEIFKKPDFQNKKKIILIHHHFSKYYNCIHNKNSIWMNVERLTLKLRGKKKILKKFNENNIDLILHGHLHEMNEYFVNDIKVLNAGGTMDNNNDLFLNINEIEIKNDDIMNTIIKIPKYKFEKKINQHFRKNKQMAV